MHFEPKFPKNDLIKNKTTSNRNERKKKQNTKLQNIALLSVNSGSGPRAREWQAVCTSANPGVALKLCGKRSTLNRNYIEQLSNAAVATKL